MRACAAASLLVRVCQEPVPGDEGYIPPERLRLMEEMRNGGNVRVGWMSIAGVVFLLAVIGVIVLNAVYVLSTGRQMPLLRLAFSYAYDLLGGVMGQRLSSSDVRYRSGGGFDDGDV